MFQNMSDAKFKILMYTFSKIIALNMPVHCINILYHSNKMASVCASSVDED